MSDIAVIWWTAVTLELMSVAMFWFCRCRRSDYEGAWLTNIVTIGIWIVVVGMLLLFT